MKHLLLIDDDANFRYTLARVLKRHGFTVATAATVEEAHHYLDRSTPDFAVVDMKLEHASGMDLIEPLRAANEAMCIVVLTGYASIATTVEAIKRGADNYLAKPLDLNFLLTALQETSDTSTPVPDSPMSLRRLQWEHIQRVLDTHDGNISAAARALGVDRRTLQRRLAKRPVRR